MTDELSQRFAKAFNLPIDQVKQVFEGNYTKCKKTWMKGNNKGELCGRYSEDEVFCKDHIKQANSMKNFHTLNSSYQGPYISKIQGDQLDRFLTECPNRFLKPNVPTYLPKFGLVYLDNYQENILYLIDGDQEAFTS